MPEFIQAIYTTQAAKREAPDAFKRRRQCEPGDQRCPVGKVLADHTRERSYLVVRVRRRVLVEKLEMQHANNGGCSVLAPRKYYQVAGAFYAAAVIAWSDGQVREIAPFTTQREAQRHIVQLHKAGHAADMPMDAEPI